MRPLPEAFSREMRALFAEFGLCAEWPDFLASFASQPDSGLRANTLKITRADLRLLLAAALDIEPSRLAPVPWSADGLYVPAGCQPGKLPHYAAGLYYIQEPSAMLPASVLAVRPGERVLDLCAAPGGKSCRIAADLRGEGLLWANEISAERARALLHNIELTGCTNCLITQETPERLAARLPGFFDKVLVDAPCSGSGMFRRDPAAMDSWQAYGSQPCAAMQRDILRSAWTMLRPGGRLVYSTCTFSLAEDEGMIGWFLEQYPDARIIPIDKAPGVSDGLPLQPGLAGTARIWPHRAAGDGHFCALLAKEPGDNADVCQTGEPAQSALPADRQSAAAWAAFRAFCGQTLTEAGCRCVFAACTPDRMRHDHACLHLLPAGFAAPANLKNVKTGLFLGQVRSLRDGRVLYEPSPAFLFSLGSADLRYLAAGRPGDDLICRYLRGETVTFGWPDAPAAGQMAAMALTAAAGTAAGTWPLGWAKVMPGGQLKNLYPQAWRRNL